MPFLRWETKPAEAVVSGRGWPAAGNWWPRISIAPTGRAIPSARDPGRPPDRHLKSRGAADPGRAATRRGSRPTPSPGPGHGPARARESRQDDAEAEARWPRRYRHWRPPAAMPTREARRPHPRGSCRSAGPTGAPRVQSGRVMTPVARGAFGSTRGRPDARADARRRLQRPASLDGAPRRAGGGDSRR